MAPTEPDDDRQVVLFPPLLDDGSSGGCAARFPLKSPRLSLRPVAFDDVHGLRGLLDDWMMVRFTANIPHPYTAEAAVDWVRDVLQSMVDGRELVLVMERVADGAVVGCVGLVPDGDGASAELGYWIAREHWGQGYAVEGARALIDLAFNELGLSRIHAAASPENVGSLKVLDKLGFAFMGPVTVPAPARGTRIPAVAYELTLAEHRSREGGRLKTLLVAAVALIDEDGRVLLAKRPEGKNLAGLWEFPGGKVDPGETPERALVRELREELGIGVGLRCLAPLSFASHGYPGFHLLMPLYACRRWRGTPTGREGQELAWVKAARLRDYPMPPADDPLIPAIQDLLE